MKFAKSRDEPIQTRWPALKAFYEGLERTLHECGISSLTTGGTPVGRFDRDALLLQCCWHHCPEGLSVCRGHQSPVMFVDDARAVPGPKGGPILVVEPGQMMGKLEHLDEAYPQAGDGYAWEPALQVVHADGNTSTALVVGFISLAQSPKKCVR